MGDHPELEAAVAMGFKSTSILKLVLTLCWVATCFTSSDSKNYLFDKVFTGQDILETIAALTTLTFAPSLFDILKSSTAPTIAALKTIPANALPTSLSKIWAVYILVFEKPDSKPRIYIGSGTSQAGVKHWLNQYKGSAMYVLPQYVQTALEEGYVITHQGLLCCCPIPHLALEAKLRLLLVGIEATLTYALWALRSKKSYHGRSSI
jgi:hypothetical protein